MKEWSATLDEFLTSVSAKGIDYETELDLSPQEQYLLQRLKRLSGQAPGGESEESNAA